MRADQMPSRDNDPWNEIDKEFNKCNELIREYLNESSEREPPTPSIVNDRGPILKDDITNLKIQMGTDPFFTGE